MLRLNFKLTYLLFLGGVVGVLQPEVGVGTGEVGAGIEGEEDLGADHGIEGKLGAKIEGEEDLGMG